MVKRKHLSIILLIIIALILIASSFIFIQKSDKTKMESCNSTLRSGCEYNGVSILSNIDSLLWTKSNLPSGTPIITWWDYGKELESVGGLNPLVKNPSKSLLQSIACMQEGIPENSGCKESDFAPFESEEKIKDVALFFVSQNENKSLCIAKKYNVEYAYLTSFEIGKYYWIYYAAYGEAPSSTLLFNIQSVHESNVTKNITLVKLLLSNEYDPQKFNLIFSNSETRIFKLNFEDSVC